MNVAFSIVSYHSAELTMRLIERLAMEAADDWRLRVDVICNDGADLHAIRAWKGPRDADVMIHDPRGNIGFGRGHALALKHLEKGSWLICLNPDISLPEGWLRQLRKALVEAEKRDPTVGLVGIPIAAQGAQEVPFPRPEKLESLRFALRICGIPVKYGNGKVYGVNGALFGVKNFGEAVFDERVFLFFEEYILAEKCRVSGRGVGVLDVPVAVHRIGASRERALPALRATFVRSQSLYLREYLGWPQMVVWALGVVTRLRLRMGGGV